MEKKRTQVPQKSAKVDILPISIYLVVVLYRHKHCRPQKVELDLACRDSTTTKTVNGVFYCSETRFYTSSNLYFIKQDHQIATINIQKI
jgi:hypothetical protein